jgi:hypothetical protein
LEKPRLLLLAYLSFGPPSYNPLVFLLSAQKVSQQTEDGGWSQKRRQQKMYRPLPKYAFCGYASSHQKIGVVYLWIEAVPCWVSKVVEVSALVAPPVEGPGAVDGRGSVQGVVHSGQGLISHQQPRGSLLFKHSRL